MQIVSPYLDYKKLDQGDRVELVLRIFADELKASLIGEHHQQFQYPYSREDFQSIGLHASLWLDQEKEAKPPSSSWKTLQHWLVLDLKLTERVIKFNFTRSKTFLFVLS